MVTDPRPTRLATVSDAAAEMMAAGESGRFEFKRDADAVSPKILAALANWVALDPERTVAHLLVGVDEVTNQDTGLTTGVPNGYIRNLDRTVSSLQDKASKVRPVPVDTFIIEEAVDTDRPFVRVELRPTAAPHYDDEGRRQTRQGRSTRALTDDELLSIYLDRESGSFAKRFRAAGQELRDSVGALSSQVDDISDAIEKRVVGPLAEIEDSAGRAAIAASDAESAASFLDIEVSNVQTAIRDLSRIVERIDDNMPDAIISQLCELRRKVWWAFSIDTYEDDSDSAEGLAARLDELLSKGISIRADTNSWESLVWQHVLSARKKADASTRSIEWWDEQMQEVFRYHGSPEYKFGDLPDLRSELRLRRDFAETDLDSETQRFLALIDPA